LGAVASGTVVMGSGVRRSSVIGARVRVVREVCCD
jgi:hypothetical protein